jgi:polysaccharide deacetylase 2 family uncharacterized protein YibQ
LSPRGRRISPATAFFALLSLVLCVALYLKSCPSRPPGPPPGTTPAPRPTAQARARTPSPVPRAGGRAAAGSEAARVAIVIDDLGNELAPAERIARWQEPVAGAVLPELRWSSESARVLERGGKEVLLHLPMEPEGYPGVRPGPGVILRSQSDAEIVRVLEADLATVPGAAGVNNHMGSAATADLRVMRTVLGVLAGRGLFFVDSRTTDATLGERLAEEASVPTVSRRVFLDDTATEAAVRGQLAELLRRARQERFAVAIGHPYPVTLSVLERELPRLSQEGIRLVPVGELAR